MLSIIEPETPDHFDAVRRLSWDYREFLQSLDQKSWRIVQALYPQEEYARLMEAIEVEHCPPNGGVRLALRDDQPVGCGFYHTIAPGVAEIKRVYVSERARGTGTGCALMQALIEQCRQDGFDFIRMHTGKPQTAATRLYLSLGFRLRDAYSEIPEIARDHLIFFEMPLGPDTA